MKFRKKPVVIEAMRLTRPKDCYDAVHWMWPEGYHDAFVIIDGRKVVGVCIPTLEGKMDANMGDWIIKGVAGEFYPCKPDIFEQTYEPAD